MGNREDVFFRFERSSRPWCKSIPRVGKVSPLISALRDEDANVVQAAIESLGLLGPRAKVCCPAPSRP